MPQRSSHTEFPVADFRRVFETAPGLFLVVVADEPRFTIVAASDAYLEAARKTREGIIGRGLFEVFPAGPSPANAITLKNLRASFRRVMATRQAESMPIQEYPLPCPDPEGDDCEERFWKPLNTPLSRLDGEVEYLIHTVQDVTNHVHMEKSREELETSRVRLEEVMNAAELGFWTWDIQANRVVGDRHFAFLFGVAEEEATKGMSAETCMQRVHPDDQSAIRESLARVFSRGGPYAIEFRTCSADTQVRWIAARGSVKLDSENRAQSLNGVVHDVTARKEAEERLKESEEHFRHTVEFNPQVPWTADPEGNILDFNHNWLELTGLTREAALGNGWMDVPHPDDRARVIAAWMHSVETGEPYDLEHRIRLADGTYRWMRSRAFARRNAEGKIVLWYGTTEDIAERKDAEDERERLLKELERSNGELAEFSHVVSHDLQTPIRMVKSFSELLARRYKGKLDEAADEVIGSIQGGAASMEQLVLKLLHYAMVGQEPMTRGPVELGRVVDAALTLLRPAVEETGAQVKHGELPTIEGDPVLLQQLFQNLINNALKYRRPSMPPRIEVHATEHEKEWFISVADNGMGIDPTYHDRIFAPLKRLHGNEIPGTGIGLAICRKIVERHGGRIWVESQLDKGSIFYFTLPQY